AFDKENNALSQKRILPFVAPRARKDYFMIALAGSMPQGGDDAGSGADGNSRRLGRALTDPAEASTQAALVRPLGAVLFVEGFRQPHPLGSQVQPSGLVKFRLGRLRVRATLFRSRAAFFDLLFPHNDGA